MRWNRRTFWLSLAGVLIAAAGLVVVLQTAASDGDTDPILEVGYAPTNILWVAPLAAELVELPSVAPEISANMCDAWSSWMADIGAVRGPLTQIPIDVSARATTAATIRSIRPVDVVKTAMESSTSIACVAGGGSNPSFAAPFNLDSSPTVIEITEFDEDSPSAIMPPDTFSIAPGGFERIVLFPGGTDGYRYSFSIEIEFVVDGRSYTRTFDDAGAPFEFGLSHPDAVRINPLGKQPRARIPLSGGCLSVDDARELLRNADAELDSEDVTIDYCDDFVAVGGPSDFWAVWRREGDGWVFGFYTFSGSELCSVVQSSSPDYEC